MRVSISSFGRLQFSVEKVYRVRYSIPSSRHASTHFLAALAPSRWPLVRGQPRWRAQRPLPSMITAICFRALVDILETLCPGRTLHQNSLGATLAHTNQLQLCSGQIANHAQIFSRVWRQLLKGPSLAGRFLPSLRLYIHRNALRQLPYTGGRHLKLFSVELVSHADFQPRKRI